MRILPIALILSITLSFMACNNTSPVCCVPHLNEDIGLSFVDGKGNDLLDPENENSFDKYDLNIYYLKDGEKSRAFNGNHDLSNNFQIFYAEEKENYAMRLLLSSHMEDGYTTTFIEFPDGSMDTLKMKAKETNTIWAQKIWYNDELIWEISNSGPSEPSYFTITKSVK